MEKLNVAKVYIVHVRENNLERRKLVTEQMGAHAIDYELMLQGDMVDMNAGNMQEFFIDPLVKNGPSPRESCSYKHLLIYEEMVKHNVPEALIFEDDIFLDENFNSVFNATMKEFRNRKDINPERLFISYENSLLEFIPKSRIQPNQYLYKTNNTRCAGAYYITLDVAKNVLDFSRKNKLELAIDWQHKRMVEAGELDVYWCEPAIAEQGSHNGKIQSLLDDKKSGLLRRISWKLQRFYKKHIRYSYK